MASDNKNLESQRREENGVVYGKFEKKQWVKGRVKDKMALIKE